MALLVVIGIFSLSAVLFAVPLAGLVLLTLHFTSDLGVLTGVIVVYALIWFPLVERNWERFDPAARRARREDLDEREAH